MRKQQLLINLSALFLFLFLGISSMSGQCSAGSNFLDFTNGEIPPLTQEVTYTDSSNWGAGDFWLLDVIEGESYTVSTCRNVYSPGARRPWPYIRFDPRLSIYSHSSTSPTTHTGDTLIAFNEDHCGIMAEVTFTAPYTGKVDIVMDGRVDSYTGAECEFYAVDSTKLDITWLASGPNIPSAIVYLEESGDGEESFSGNSPIQFVVELSEPNATDDDIIIYYRSTDYGTATIVADYDSADANGSVLIEPGVQSAYITIDLTNDYVPEAEESFVVELYNHNLDTLTFTTDTARALIADDDSYELFVSRVKHGFEAEEDSLVYEVLLSDTNWLGEDIKFYYKSSEYTEATLGTDCEDIPEDSYVSIPHGSDRAYIYLKVTNDTLVEGDEEVDINIYDYSFSRIETESPSAFADIIDDDFYSASISLKENGAEDGEDDKSIEFNVDLGFPNASDGDIKIYYRVKSGSATEGDDYYSLNEDEYVLFEPGTSNAIISIDIVDDQLVEDLEDVVIELYDHNLDSLVFSIDSASGTITDNDIYELIIDYVSDASEKDMDSLQYVVYLYLSEDQTDNNNYPTEDIKIYLEDTYEGSATSGYDYDSIPDSAYAVIKAGEDHGFFYVPIKNDTIIEDEEDVELRIAGYSVDSMYIDEDSTAWCDIEDDEYYSVEIYLDENGNGAETDNKTMDFVVKLSDTSVYDNGLEVSYRAKLTSTAVAGKDYVAIDEYAYVEFETGEQFAYFSIDVIDDSFVENLEQLVVELYDYDVDTLAFSTDTAVATILDNDVYAVEIDDEDDAYEEDMDSLVYEIELLLYYQIDKNDFIVDGDYDWDAMDEAADSLYELGSVLDEDIIIYLKDTYYGDATAGLDYDSIPDSAYVVIPKGEYSAFYYVPIKDDSIVERDEEVTLTISGYSLDSMYIEEEDNYADAEINSDDSYKASVYRKTDGKVGSQMAEFEVRLDQVNMLWDMDIYYTDANIGSGIDGSDYTSPEEDTYVEMLEGDSVAIITIPILDDNFVEPLENLSIRLTRTSSNFMELVKTVDSVNILDNDVYAVEIDDEDDAYEEDMDSLVYEIELMLYYQLDRNDFRVNGDIDWDAFDEAEDSLYAAGNVLDEDIIIYLKDTYYGDATAGLDYDSIPDSAYVVIPKGEYSAFYYAWWNGRFRPLHGHYR